MINDKIEDEAVLNIEVCGSIYSNVSAEDFKLHNGIPYQVRMYGPEVMVRRTTHTDVYSRGFSDDGRRSVSETSTRKSISYLMMDVGQEGLVDVEDAKAIYDKEGFEYSYALQRAMM